MGAESIYSRAQQLAERLQSRREADAERSEAAGLVSSQTSGTPVRVIQIDPHESRIRRLQKAVNASAYIVQSRAKRGFRPPKAAMLTLTYRDEAEWQPRHISDLLTLMRKYARRRGIEIPYVWVAELTKRGRLHYHVMLWLPRGVTIPKPDKQGWWRHGSTRIEWARSPVGYLCKYASKGTGDEFGFPSGARIHGAGGLDDAQKAHRRWCISPEWVKDAFPDWSHDIRPAEGGGWYSRKTGDIERSPWKIEYREGRLCAVRFEQAGVYIPPGWLERVGG